MTMGAGMKKVKTSELSERALDWAVAKCEGHDAHTYNGVVRTTMRHVFGPECKYSTDWSHGGPIIEREHIEIMRLPADNKWGARKPSVGGLNRTFCMSGPTPLTAAMRCYVASRLGDEIEIPEELL